MPRPKANLISNPSHFIHGKNSPIGQPIGTKKADSKHPSSIPPAITAWFTSLMAWTGFDFPFPPTSLSNKIPDEKSEISPSLGAPS